MACSQINVKSVEDLDVIHEELLGVPLLLRVWAEHQQNHGFTGDQNVELPRWESEYLAHPLARSTSCRVSSTRAAALGE